MDKQVSFEDEPLMLVDMDGMEVGNLSKDACHKDKGILHRAFSIFILDAKGNVLIQQRSQQKKLWPLYWSNSCCSHPRLGEKIEDAANRRLEQELGIKAKLTKHYEFEYQEDYEDIGAEHELCTVFTGITDDEITVNSNEIVDWRWMPPKELTEKLSTEHHQFTPWLRLEWDHLTRHFSSALLAG